MRTDIICLGNLVKRELKLFLKDKAAVFFSLLAPLIILMLYVLFLGDLQVSAVEQAFEGTTVSHSLIKSFIDGWMLAGVVSVSCITVAFSAYNVVLNDKENGTLDDILASPVKRWVITASYYFYNFVVTSVICGLLLVVVFVYLAISGWYLTVGHTFAIVGVTVLSIVSSTLFATAICGFLKTTNAHSACVGILSAIIGFLIGAYMPVDMFPKAVQYIILFVPGTYSAGVLRNLFMSGVLNEIGKDAPYHVEPLKDSYSMNMDFFGHTIGQDFMLYALLVTIVLLVAINVGIFFIRKATAKKPHIKRKSVQ